MSSSEACLTEKDRAAALELLVRPPRRCLLGDIPGCVRRLRPLLQGLRLVAATCADTAFLVFICLQGWLLLSQMLLGAKLSRRLLGDGDLGRTARGLRGQHRAADAAQRARIALEQAQVCGASGVLGRCYFLQPPSLGTSIFSGPRGHLIRTGRDLEGAPRHVQLLSLLRLLLQAGPSALPVRIHASCRV